MYPWEHLTEDALWALATDWRQATEVREEAWDRWLFPEDYGYGWARLRVQQLRTHCLRTESDSGILAFETVPVTG